MKLIYANPDPMPAPSPPSLHVIQTTAEVAKRAETHRIARRDPSLHGSSRGDMEVRNALAAYYGVTIPENLHLHLLTGSEYNIAGMRLFWSFPFTAGVAATIREILRSPEAADAILVRNHKLAEFLLRHRRLLRLPSVVFETHELFVLSCQDEMQRTGKQRPEKAARLEELERYVYGHSD